MRLRLAPLLFFAPQQFDPAKKVSYRLPFVTLGLRVTGYGLPVTGYRLPVTGYGYNQDAWTVGTELMSQAVPPRALPRRPVRAESFHIVPGPAETPEMGDKELIEALRRGQNSAWTELVERYIRLVHHVVRQTLSVTSRGRLDQDVEDITHDLFKSLVKDDYRVLGTIDAPYDLKAWLAISARRRAIDFARKRKPPSVSLDQAREDHVSLSATVAAQTTSTEGETPAHRQAAVTESLAILNAKERLVVQLFYLDGKKYREISRITGMNMNSISPTLVRAVEKMQRYLTDRTLMSP